MKMKRVMTMAVVMLLMAEAAKAQLWDELFNQSKTQTKYLLQQIAALKVYIDHAQKTYRIAGDGLKFIGSVTGAEKELHDGYFTSLKEVSPQVRSYPRTAEIIAIARAVIDVRKRQLEELRREDMLSAEEMHYVEKVLLEIVEDCAKVLEELESVTQRGKLEMSDDERLKRINMLYAQISDDYEVAKGFGTAAIELSMLRQRQRNETENSRVLQGGR